MAAPEQGAGKGTAMMTLTDEIAFLTWLVTDNGYANVKPIPGGRWAATEQKMFTCAIITGRMGDRVGIDDHWCYATEREARVALDAWDGLDEPTGWDRHPFSGRRISRTIDEIDGDGRLVGEDVAGSGVGAAGVMYWRP